VATAAGFRPWPELTEQSIPSRLRLLASRGCPAVYLWSAGDSSDATHWTAIEQGQVREYLAAELARDAGSRERVIGGLLGCRGLPGSSGS
jgi:hypothetical protein